jgi:hypothetical protein
MEERVRYYERLREEVDIAKVTHKLFCRAPLAIASTESLYKLRAPRELLASILEERPPRGTMIEIYVLKD